MINFLDRHVENLVPKSIRELGGKKLSMSLSYLTIAVIVLPLFVFFAVLYHLMGLHIIAYYAWAAAIIGCISYWGFYFFESPNIGAHLLTVGATLTLFGGSLYAGGISAPGVIWLADAQLLSALLFKNKAAVVWSILFCFGAIVLAFADHFGLPSTNLIAPEFETMTKLICVIGSSIVMVIMTAAYNHNEEKMQSLITAQNQQLTRKLEENMGLVRVLSHDINNALVIIDYAAQKLRSFEATQNHELYMKQVERVAKGAETISAIVNQVKQQQSITTGKLKLELTGIDIEKVFDESIFLLKPSIEQKQIRFSFSNEMPEGTMVLAERVSCTNNIINNLMTNAIKFSKSGGQITASLKPDPTEIKRVLVVIKDNGIGIPTNLVKRLFDIKEKTTRVGTAGEKGTGFGMPLVKSYMNLYGGDITVESRSVDEFTDNCGTTITLSFLKG